MAVKIKPLRKFSTGNPSASDMEVGEIAVNTADQKIFMKDDNNDVVEVANASGNITGDLLITSTDTDAIEDPSLILYRNSSNPAVDDELGEIVFRGRNDNSENIDYVKVYTEIKDETDGTESGALKFEVMRDGNIASFMTMSGEANQIYMNKKFNMQNNNITNIGNLTFEGSTNDTNETTFTVTDPTADRTITFPDASGTVFTSGNPNAITDIGVQAFDVQLGTGSDLIFEGATSNANETTLTVVDPTADRTITLPDATGQVVLSDGVIDTDASAEIGRVHVGHMGFSDFAGFSHVDNNTSTNYALLQASNGKTYLNSASGQPIDFRIGNTTHASLSNTAFDITSFSDGGPILNLISNDASDVADFTKEGTISFKSENDASEETEFSKITLMTDDVSDGTEDGRIRLQAMNNGSMRDVLDITGHSVQVRNSLPIRWEAAGGSGVHAQLQVASISSGRTYTLPDATGTVALTSQIPTVPTNASIHLKPHFVKVSNEDSATAGTKYIKVATINSSTPSNSSSTFVFRILLEGRNELNGASQFRVHIRTGDNAAKSSVVVEQEHSNRHTYYGIDSFIFLWNSQNNSEFWVKLPNNGDTAYQQLFAKLEVSAPEDTEYVSGHDDVTIHTSQAWTTSTPSGTNQITAEWIKKRFDSIIFEGSTTNTSETFLQAADPTADRTITLPDASGTVHTTANPEINGAYGSTSAPRIFKVTVATQTTAHPYNGDGSINKYSIDGVQGAALTLHGADDDTANSEYIYRFDQSDNTNNGHPLRFYLEANKTTAYTTGVTTNGTPGQAGAYTQIAVTRNTPKVLYYQCSQHGYMGNYVTIATAGIGAVVDDTSPQLGGNLDGNTYDIQLDNNSKYQWGQTAAATYITGNSSSTHTNSNIQFWLQSGNGFVTPTLYLESTGIMMPTNKDIRFEGTAADAYETTLTVTNPTADRTITFPDASGTVALTSQLGGGGSASDSFKTIAVSGQSDVVADSSTDTLTLVAGSNMSITTNASGDSITFASSGGGGTASDSFKTISVSGQSDVVADSSTDTLTLVAGNNMTITTNASGDEISFAASGGAGSGISEEQAIAFAIVYG